MKIKSFLTFFAYMAIMALMFACKDPNPPVGPGGDGHDTIPSDTVPDVVDNTDYDKIYHYGNCKKSDAHGSLLGIMETHDYGAATLIDVQKLAQWGTKIVGVRVYIGGSNITNESVFLGSSYRNPTYTQDFTYKAGGWNVVMLDEPMDIPEKNFYVGYKITGFGYTMGMEQGSPKDGEMLYIDAWSPITQAAGNYVNSIQLLVAGGNYTNYVQEDLVLENVKVSACRAGQPVKVVCEVRNAGVITAKEAKIKCNFGGQSCVADLNEPVVHGQTVRVVIPNVVAPANVGTHNMTLNLEWEKSDDIASNNSHSTVAEVYPADAPERVAVLLEQFTGQDCPNCPSGAAFLAQQIGFVDNPEKVIWIAHHNYGGGDAFSLDESLYIGSVLGATSAPSLCVDRMVSKHDKNGNRDPYGTNLVFHPGCAFAEYIQSWIERPGTATIEMTRTFDAATGELSITVSGRLTEENQYITALVKQSGMEARQRGGSDSYEHNNAPRLFLTAGKGDAITPDADGNYSVTLTATVPGRVDAFNTDFAQMEVVAYVHGDINDSEKRAVANAIEMPLLEVAKVPAFVRYQEMINSFVAIGGSTPSFSSDNYRASGF